MTTERDEKPEVPEQAEGRAAEEALSNDPGRLKELLDEERAKAQQYMQNWQRAAADFQNFKRRVEDERSEVARFANAALVINLLPLIDDLDRALHNVDAHLAGLTWVDGIRLIHRKFQAVLEMTGVEEIRADGETFDPSLHEAVATAPQPEGGAPSGTVVEVYQDGYRIGEGVVIRPARVVVAA